MFVTPGLNKEKVYTALSGYDKERITIHRERVKRQLQSTSTHYAEFYDMLCQIQDDRSKVIKSDKLDSNEYIFFDGSAFRRRCISWSESSRCYPLIQRRVNMVRKRNIHSCKEIGGNYGKRKQT